MCVCAREPPAREREHLKMRGLLCFSLGCLSAHAQRRAHPASLRHTHTHTRAPCAACAAPAHKRALRDPRLSRRRSAGLREAPQRALRQRERARHLSASVSGVCCLACRRVAPSHTQPGSRRRRVCAGVSSVSDEAIDGAPAFKCGRQRWRKKRLLETCARPLAGPAVFLRAHDRRHARPADVHLPTARSEQLSCETTFVCTRACSTFDASSCGQHRVAALRACGEDTRVLGRPSSRLLPAPRRGGHCAQKERLQRGCRVSACFALARVGSSSRRLTTSR